MLQCNLKPDWDPQQVAQTGLVYQCLGPAWTQEFSSCGSKHLCRRLQLVICSCLIGHTLMSPQISSVHPLFPVTTAAKCFLLLALDRASQNAPKTTGQEFSTLTLLAQLSLGSKISMQKVFSSSSVVLTLTSFLSGICWVFLANSSCTHWVCHRQHRSPWWMKPAVHPLVAAAESHHSARSLQGLINSLLWIRKEFWSVPFTI